MSFDFKRFSINDFHCAMKVGTDGVLIGAWTNISDAAPRSVLDLGAGSGIISLMIAQRYPDVRVTAVEIDPGATEDCAANFRSSPFASRLTAVCSPAETFEPEIAPGLIVSNPPFFTNGMLSPSDTRRQARHQQAFGPKAAIAIAARLLADNGSLAMITPADDEDDLVFEAQLHRLNLQRLCKVSTVESRPATRLLWQFSRCDCRPEITQLTIKKAGGGYTPAFASLTRDFYLNL